MHYVISGFQYQFLNLFLGGVTQVFPPLCILFYMLFHDNYEFNMKNDSKAVDPQVYTDCSKMPKYES